MTTKHNPKFGWLWIAYLIFIILLLAILASCSTTQLPAHMNHAKKLPKTKKQKVSWVQKTKINVIKKTFKY